MSAISEATGSYFEPSATASADDEEEEEEEESSTVEEATPPEPEIEWVLDEETGLLTMTDLQGNFHEKDEEGNEYITNADGVSGEDYYADSTSDTWTYEDGVYSVTSSKGFTYEETDYSMDIHYADGSEEFDYWEQNGDYWGENTKDEYWFYSGDGCLSVEWEALLVTYNNCDEDGNKYGSDSVGDSWWDSADGTFGWYAYADGTLENYTISADGSEIGTDSTGGRFFYGKDGSGVYTHGDGT